MVSIIIPRINQTVSQADSSHTCPSAHGLTGTSVGKPIGFKANELPIVWDDTVDPSDVSNANRVSPVAILKTVISTTVVRLAWPGSTLVLSNALVPGSLPVNGSDGNSRHLFWDLSLNRYVHTVPVDSQVTLPCIYYLGPGVVAGTVNVLVLLPNIPNDGVI